MFNCTCAQTTLHGLCTEILLIWETFCYWGSRIAEFSLVHDKISEAVVADTFHLLQHHLASTSLVFYIAAYGIKIFINTVFLYYNKKTFLTPVVCRICFFSAFLCTYVQLQIWMPGWCSKGVKNEIICDASRCHEVSSSESNSTLGSFDQLPSGFRIHPALRARIIKTGNVSFYNHS